MASEGRSEMSTSTTAALLPAGTAHGELRNGGGDNGVVGGNKRRKLHGRAFYESIGSPKLVLAPMVEQSEFAWRLLTRSFLPPSSQTNLLAYTPMFHSKMFSEKPKYRDSHFQPLRTSIPSPADTHHTSPIPSSDRHLDGNPECDRPLTVQFCSNDPDDLLNAAKLVAPFCDAVDLNLGCPQGIARKGHYGAFLQEDWDLIARMINKLHQELDVPVTAKMRILETPEKTLSYAQTILKAGASIITVHGRQRDQKGHNTGLADWTVLRYLRSHLPPDTVIFANGNVLQHEDIAACLEVTGADAVMSAEGNLHDPTIFAAPPAVGLEGREYWRGRDGKGGYRMDAVMRRYMDIIHKYGLGQEPPVRRPLFLPSDPVEESTEIADSEDDGPPKKKQKQEKKTQKVQRTTNPNLTAMQAHLFHLLRPLVAQHHNVRDALARCRVGDVDAFENVLTLVENAVKEGLTAYEAEHPSSASIVPTNGISSSFPTEPETKQDGAIPEGEVDPNESSAAAIARCKRPYWVCQAYVRPVPKEALEKGSMQLSKKEKKRLEKEAEEVNAVGLVPEGRIETEVLEVEANGEGEGRKEVVEIPRDGVVCG